MQRRIARQRREYLFRKNQENQSRAILEKKARLKHALDAGRSIPSDLRKEAGTLNSLISKDDPDLQLSRDAIDDEYARAGAEDPRVLVTTSRDPSTRLAQFAKEMRLVFPNATRLNRGTYVLEELIEDCRARGVTDLVILHEHRGEPDGMIVCHMPYGPTAYFSMSNVVMRHDIPDACPVSEAYPHLIFHNFTSRLGKRVSNILRFLFPVPKADAHRVLTFANEADVISFRHHVYRKEDKDMVILQEVGPRFDLRLYQIRLGTADMKHAELEWVLRPYMNTARKHHALTAS